MKVQMSVDFVMKPIVTKYSDPLRYGVWTLGMASTNKISLLKFVHAEMTKSPRFPNIR